MFHKFFNYSFIINIPLFFALSNEPIANFIISIIYIDLSIWTHAYQWYSEKQHKIIRYLDKYWFKKNSEFHKQDIKDYIGKVSQNEWESFTDLFEKIKEIREILFDDTNWKFSKCSCCYWLKNYICSHIIILAVTLTTR